MKRSSNVKGFTLIELLAVIVILAVVLVVAIPAVLSSMSTAKEQTLSNTVNTVTEWFEKEYQASLLGSADAEYTTFAPAAGTPKVLDAATATAAGINKTSNFDLTKSKVLIKANGRACIKLVASDSGDFKQVTNKTVYSSVCTDADKTTLG